MPVIIKSGKKAHDRENPTHLNFSGHYCLTFDGLWLCAECPEFRVCECDEETRLKNTTPETGTAGELGE